MRNSSLPALILFLNTTLFSSCLAPESEGSRGYRLTVASALEKVFPDTEGSGMTANQVTLSLAQNECEGFQIIIEALERDIVVEGVELSPLEASGNKVIPADALSWRRVDYVETSITPVYPVDRIGQYPDPLMPAGPFAVEKDSRVSVWVTVQTNADSAPGTYNGTVTVQPEGLTPSSVSLTVTVWDFALEDETHLRTLTWLGESAISHFYQLDNSAGGLAQLDKYLERYEDILLQHRLGPGGLVAEGLRKHPETGQFDFSEMDRRLERLFSKGMNVFLMGTAPNLKRQGEEHYTEEFIAEFTERLKAFGDHLRSKGWIDRAYVYVYDEAPEAAWPEVKKMSRAIRAAAPELRIIQCLSEPAGVQALQGFVDVFDVYITHYHQTGVAHLQSEGTEAWLAVCCCPADNPNLFIEYPLLDARVIPMFCWKYGVQGFEYWSPNHWGRNPGKDRTERWPNGPWDPNSFGEYNGDGYLLYPGPEGVPYPSIRLKALRDGFEDYEYMWTLNQLVEKATRAGKGSLDLVQESKRLLGMEELITNEGDFVRTEDRYFSFREKVANSIVALKRLSE
jgi:hypothetical protein